MGSEGLLKQTLADFPGILDPISNVFLNNQLTFQGQFQSKRLRSHCLVGLFFLVKRTAVCEGLTCFRIQKDLQDQKYTHQIFPDQFWSNKNQDFDELQNIKVTLQYET